MFDPGLSIYATMVLSNLTEGINDSIFKCGPLYITVDSQQYFLLNWDYIKCDRRQHPDVIKFYTFDEKRKIVGESVETRGIARNYYKTKYQFSAPFEKFPLGWNIDETSQKLGSHCLPFVIESRRNGRVIDRRCMRIFPNWMKDFGELRLGEMMIPGTHNSGAYTGVPSVLMTRYVLNQARDLYEQLVFGQRYFDIRVGIPSQGEIRITHNIIQTSTLEEELDFLVAFVQKSPREIIILDLHKFNIPAHFTEKDHKRTIELIQKKIGKYIIPRTAMGSHKYGPKLETLWSYNKSIIVAYNDTTMVRNHKILWPPIHRDWGNKIDIEDMKKYMIEVARSKRIGNPMRVLMAEMTPNLAYIVSHPSDDLGQLADCVNRNITFWIRDYNLQFGINLIASDFFLGNRMTEFSIGVNNMKLQFMKRKSKSLE